MLISFPGLGHRSEKTNAAEAEARRVLQQMRGYWEAQREGVLPPKRSQIDPRGLEGALSGAFILERVAPGVARFRIAGSHLAELAGCDPRGMPMSVLFEPRGRSHLGDALEQVFNGPATLEMQLEAERGVGRPALTAQVMILPLRNDWGKTDLAIGVVALIGEVGKRARRFHIARVTVTALPKAPVAAPAEAEAGLLDPVLFGADFSPAHAPNLSAPEPSGRPAFSATSASAAPKTPSAKPATPAFAEAEAAYRAPERAAPGPTPHRGERPYLRLVHSAE